MSATTSAAVPRLRPEDLPAVPRPVGWTLAVDVLAGGGLLLLVPAAFAAILTAFMALDGDLRDHDGDPPVGNAVVTVCVVDHRDDDDGPTRWLVRGRLPDGSSVSSYFDAEVKEGERLDVRQGKNGLVLAGGRVRPHAPLGVLAPAVVALGLLAGSLVAAGRNKKHLHLLRAGKIGKARLLEKRVEKQEEGADVNVFFFSFFDDRDRKREVVVRWGPVYGHLTDQEEEAVLYDDDSAALLDALPGRPQLVAGRFVAREGSASVGRAVLVLTCVALIVVSLALVLPLGLR